ncbi:MAG: c-type cytochrome [Rhodospirillaceae bacterium]|nr:c-type cytochrome [Rhodospirillaceae bacterium]
MKIFTAIASMAVVMAVTGPALAGGDAADGEDYFKKKCKACHSIEAGKNGAGPNLAGIMGRQVASTDFSRYLGLKDMDFVWDADSMDAFLTDPGEFVGGKSMVVKVKEEDDRADLITYMETLK